MSTTTVFVGSSSAARLQAKALIRELESESVRFLPWWDTFTPGRTLLEELDAIRTRVQGALLIFSPESQSTIRRKRHSIPNLNVLFEFGYFYGQLGKQRVAMIRYGEFYLPSDLDGYIHIFGSKGFSRGGARRVNDKTRKDFERWLGRF